MIEQQPLKRLCYRALAYQVIPAGDVGVCRVQGMRLTKLEAVKSVALLIANAYR